MTIQMLNDRYQVIRTLGAGGFGETYLAEDTYMPSKRLCVVKQLRPIHNNPQIYLLVQERFQREAAILEELGGANDQINSGIVCLLFLWWTILLSSHTEQQFFLAFPKTCN